MKTFREILPKAAVCFLIFTLLCGLVYTALITGFAQLFFPDKANGSIIEVDGVKYGSSLLAQYYTDDGHMWGRIMNLDVTTYKDDSGRSLLYSAPSNLSPVSAEYTALVSERVDRIKAANPDMGDTPIPVDLVTCSGSGLDPAISPAAAEYQAARIADARGISESEVREIIRECTTGKFLGLFGEETVNVLKVNLMLDGIIAY